VAIQSMLDQGQVDGNHYYWKSEYLAGLPDEAIETFVTIGATVSAAPARITLMQLGGAIGDRDEMAIAAGHRQAEFMLAINNGWRDPAEDEQQIQWTRDFWKAMRPFSTGGVYVNFLTADEGPERVRAAYGEEKYQRLEAIKAKYDPGNLFRQNQNIRPSGR
jgi:FAD/FMN-containing dehydrogenase